jgi:hypothetical protein
MAWSLQEHVIRAAIDNRIRGIVTGRIWLDGRPEPLRLLLRGNAWSDLAGCLVWIENPSFRPGSFVGLATEQRGVCGDLTAKRAGRMAAALPVEWVRRYPHLPVPQVWGTGIYLEWFSERNGRIVIELMGCWTCVSERAWRPSAEEQLEPAWCNLTAVDQFLCSRARLDGPA